MGSLANTFPIIPHEAVAGVDCCGRIVPVEQGQPTAAPHSLQRSSTSVVQLEIIRELVRMIPDVGAG
jgi:hypothetical protein